MPELEPHLASDYDIYTQRHLSHVHLKNTVSGIVLTDDYADTKFVLDAVNFDIKALGGFTFDDVNNRFYWDQANNIGRSLPAIFAGNAGVEVTAGLGGGVKVFLAIFIDGSLLLETPLTFDALSVIQSYGASSPLLDSNDADLLQQGSYYEFRAKADTGQAPTIKIDYFNTTIERA